MRCQSELLRCQVAERAVRSLGVVLDSPVLNDLSCVRHRQEPVFIQALVPEAPVEALDVGVLDRLARSDEAEYHMMLVGPRSEALGSRALAG